MTTAVEVCTTLIKYGVTLHDHAGQRRMCAPKGGLTETLRQTIREHQAGLRTLFTPGPYAWGAPGAARCPHQDSISGLGSAVAG